MRKALIRFSGSAGGAVGDFLAEVVALAEHLAGDAHNFFGVVVIFGKDQRLGHLFPPWEKLRQAVLVGGEDGANLALSGHLAVQLVRVVGEILIELLPALAAGALIPASHPPAFLDGAALLGDAGADAVHLAIHVDPICHRPLARVLHHQVLVEETEGLLAGRGGQTDESWRRSIPAPAATGCRWSGGTRR